MANKANFYEEIANFLEMKANFFLNYGQSQAKTAKLHQKPALKPVFDRLVQYVIWRSKSGQL